MLHRSITVRIKDLFRENGLSSIAPVIILCLSIVFSPETFAQNRVVKKKDNITVTTLQNMSFGTFYIVGSGGSVTVTSDGSRSASGGIITANQSTCSPVIFEAQGPINTYIYIQKGSDVRLKTSKGGTVTLHLESSNPESPFIPQKSSTQEGYATQQVSMGGTLTAGDSKSSPAGNYSGTFYITFIQE